MSERQPVNKTIPNLRPEVVNWESSLDYKPRGQSTEFRSDDHDNGFWLVPG